MSYSPDFRKKVLETRQKHGLTVRETAQRFCIGVATLTRWIKNPHIRRRLSRPRKLDRLALLRDVEQYPQAYQYERAARFGVSNKAIWQALKALGITYKKNTSPSQSERRRTACLPAKNSNLS